MKLSKDGLCQVLGWVTSWESLSFAWKTRGFKFIIQAKFCTVSSSVYNTCPVLPCPVLPCPVLSCPVLSCPVLSCPVLSCPVLSCPVLSCPVLSCPDAVSNNFVMLCCVLLCAMLSYAVLSCCVVSYAVLYCPVEGNDMEISEKYFTITIFIILLTIYLLQFIGR